MNSPPEFFGPQASVYGPLLVPRGFKCRRGDATQPITNVRTAKRRKSSLDLRVLVGIGGTPVRIGIQDSLGRVVEQDQRSVVKPLIQKIVVHPLGEAASIAEV